MENENQIGEKSFERLLLESVQQHQEILVQLQEQNKLLARKIERLENQMRATLQDVGVTYKGHESLADRVEKIEQACKYDGIL